MFRGWKSLFQRLDTGHSPIQRCLRPRYIRFRRRAFQTLLGPLQRSSRPLCALGFSYKCAAMAAKLLPRRLSNYLVGLIYGK